MYKIVLGISSDSTDHPDLDRWTSILEEDIYVHEDQDGHKRYLTGAFASPRLARAEINRLRDLGLEGLQYFGIEDDCRIVTGWADKMEIGQCSQHIKITKS